MKTKKKVDITSFDSTPMGGEAKNRLVGSVQALIELIDFQGFMVRLSFGSIFL